MKKHYFLKLSLLLIALSSCTSTRNTTYFQGMDRSKDLSQAINNFSPLTIQSGDLLGLNVSSVTPDAATFNTGTVGFIVDQKGEVHLPLIQPVKVVGLTISQAEVVLKNNMLSVLKDPVVNVHILNFKISVIGDVGHSGIFQVQGERITIPEALGQAGDLTITAKRKNVLLIREINGERKFINIDMTSSNLFNSPYYYLKNNDVIYVEATNAKYTTISGFNRTFPVVSSLLSLGLSIVGIILITRK